MQQKENKFIEDFNFQSSFSVFSNDAACNAKNKVDHGDPFYTDKTYLLFHNNNDKSYYEDDWNEGTVHNLPFGFCYTMHCLMHHSNIDLPDILMIHDVWIDLKVDYQFFIETEILPFSRHS